MDNHESPNNWRNVIAQSILDLGGKLHKRFPSIFTTRSFQSPLAKSAFRKLSARQELLTYREKDLALQCHKRHWVSYSLGLYEPVTRGVMESLFKPGMVFVDGGANIGLYSLLASRVVGDKGMIHAFEPHPGVYEVLKSNIASNRSDNVRPWNVALGATRGTAWLHDSTEPGSHTLLGAASPGGHPVEVLPLDEVVEEGRVDLAKLDLEGSEPLALQGMKGILRRPRKPVILMEFCSHWLERAGVSPFDSIEILESHGYRLMAIDEQRKRGPFDLDAREKRALETGEFNYNLLCIPALWSYDT